MVRQLPTRSDRYLIRIKRPRKDGPYVCLDCCGVEDVVNIRGKDALWKHLEDFHQWPDSNKSLLSIEETYV